MDRGAKTGGNALIKVTDIALGVQALAKELTTLGKKRIAVGVSPKTLYPDGTPVVEIAALHEFGAPSAGIPQRSFLRAFVDAARPAIAQKLGNAASNTMTLQQLGAWAVAEVRKRVPVDTGKLREAIQYRIVDAP